jgi:hypothetical protein
VSDLVLFNSTLTKANKIKDWWQGPHMSFPETGKQILIRFDNDYGVSIVQFACPPFIQGQPLYGSYGVDKGLYELAVTKYVGEKITDLNLCYSTPITDNVIGNLSEEEVVEIVKKVSEL